VTPLDIYLREAGPEEAAAAVIDWGYTLKDLAAANIFAGDMLLKNFGVTRHGRVVFYDYDELCPLTDCSFRTFPAARDDLDEMAPEPWFSVGESDVFPAEFGTFLGLDGALREVFLDHHADLLEVEFWRLMQERNRSGEIIDFYPYTERRRLRGPG
jgi:isocitrate dehydrogenase kinase/phosphatase